MLSRQEAMDEARRRLQERYDAQAARHAEEVKKVRTETLTYSMWCSS